MRYSQNEGGEWVRAARQALELLRSPCSVPTILQVIDDNKLLVHNSKKPCQTLRNEIRKSCEGIPHRGGYKIKFFHQQYRGVYGLIDKKDVVPAEAWRPQANDIPVNSATLPELSARKSKHTSTIRHMEVLSEDEAARFPEGEAKYVMHRKLERDTSLAMRAKKWRLKKFGKLSCDVCKFSFGDEYGAFAVGYIEAHHVIAVSKLNGKTKPRIRDLAMVCSNCHRMLHYKRPWLTISQLKFAVKKARF